MADTSDIIKNLRQLGLGDSETQVYLRILTQDVVSIMSLAKDLNIPRTTVYRICQKLVKENFLEWVVERQGMRVKAVAPNRLGTVIERKKQMVKEMEAALEKVKLMMPHLPKHAPRTQVRYYQGLAGMKQLIWNSLKTQGENIGYSVYERDLFTGKEFEDAYREEMIKRKFTERVIIKPQGKSLENAISWYKGGILYQTVRIVEDADFYIAGDTYVYNDIYAFNFWEGDEIVGVEIENPEIAKIERSLFNYVWERATPLEKYIKK